MEVLSTLCKKRDVASFLDMAAEDNLVPKEEVKRIASYGRNFFKHADRDPNATLDDFYDGRNDGVLYAAIKDLRTLNNNRLPLEAQAFETWFAATFPDQVIDGADYLARVERLYPNFGTMSREDLKRMARTHLHDALQEDSITQHPDTDTTEMDRWK